VTTGARRFLSNAFYLYANEGILLLLTTLVYLRVIAALGPEQFGVYSTVLAFTFFFKMFTESSGVDDLLIADMSRGTPSREEFDLHVSSGVLLRLGLGLLAFALSVTVSAFLYRGQEAFPLIALLSLGMLFSFNKRKNPFILRYVIEERRLPPEAVIFTVSVLLLGVKLALTFGRAPLWAYVLLDLLLVLVLSGAFLLMGANRGHFRISPRLFRLDLAKSLFLRSLPLSISGIFVYIFMRIDQLMLGKMQGMEAVGIYSVAVLLVEGLNIAPALAANLLMPVWARTRDRGQMKPLLALCFRAAVWSALLLVGVYTLLGEQVLHLLWGDRYLASLAPLKILAWNSVFAFVGGLSGSVLVVYGLQGYFPVLVAVMAATNVALNLLLIPLYGPAGAALATCLSFGFGSAFSGVFPRIRFLVEAQWREILPLGLFAGAALYPWPGLGTWRPAFAAGAMAAGTVFLVLHSLPQMRMLSSPAEIPLPPPPSGRNTP